MSRIAWIVFWIFFPASLGVLGQVLWGPDLSHRLLALGLFLFSIDQARMAVLDLRQAIAAQRQTPDFRIRRFYWVTLTTIVLEILGFGIAAVWLGWGIQLVLLSQVWFNLFAGIQIQPPDLKIQPWGVRERLPVLIADGLGMGLMGLWMREIAPMGIVLTLWGMAIAYACLKYFSSLRKRPSESEP